jgi:NADPH2:quinone reductase
MAGRVDSEVDVRAVQVVTLNGPAAVQLSEVPEPTTSGGSVVVEVHAAGVAFPDVLLTRGRYQYRPDPPFTLGAEISGVVRSAPAGSAVRPGDRVAAFPMFGGFAEVVAVQPHLVLPLPDSVSFETGAALPMNYLTAHFALLRRGRLTAGETVLVHGAAGGVGTAAVQLARAQGARVLAVVSSEQKADMARTAGAHEVVLAEGFRDAVKELTRGAGVDIVVDPVGGDRFTDSLRSLAPEGRLLVIGFTGGEIPTVKVNRLLLNNIEVVGVGWGAFWMSRPEFLQEQWAQLLPLLADGRIDPPIGRAYPMEQTAAALDDVEQRRALGKLVLTIR